METKNEKFIRLSTQRLEKALFGMKQLTQLTSHHYEFSDEQVQELLFKLRTGVSEVAEAFGVTEEPISIPDVPRRLEEGELELCHEETGHLIRVGPQIDAAIAALSENKPEEAENFLLNLMRS